jgi:hypothetical protein
MTFVKSILWTLISSSLLIQAKNFCPQLYPSRLAQDGEAAWRAHFELQGVGLKIFSEACTDWEGLNSLQYGDVGLDDVVFRVREDGNARSVELKGWRVVLEKE